MRIASVFVALVLLIAAQAPLPAQIVRPEPPPPTPGWAGHLAALSANAALSALAAGILQELRGGSFKDGFTRGALGGVVIYAGKRVATERYFGAGFIGRQLAGAGSSMVRNAGDDIGTLDRLIFPVGFARVQWSRKGTDRVSAKVDVNSLGWTLYGLLEPELHLDIRESVSAGTLVFSTDDKVIRFHDEGSAFVVAGVVFRSRVTGWEADDLANTLAHERVHVLQQDQLFLSVTEPITGWLVHKLPGGRAAYGFLDLNLSAEFMGGIGLFISHPDRPWEAEANYLSK